MLMMNINKYDMRNIILADGEFVCLKMIVFTVAVLSNKLKD